MNIFITLDYELYMSGNTGTVSNCIIKPVEKLMEVANKHQVKFSFFVDAAFLYRLYQLKDSCTQLFADYRTVCENIQMLDKYGHDVEMHFHPQWLYSDFVDGKWIVDMTHYKISDMDETFLFDVFEKSKMHLDSLLSSPTVSFRAGGYSLSSFAGFMDLFKRNNITIDSSVLRNSYCDSRFQSYNYIDVPIPNIYKISCDLCRKDESGSIVEASISTKRLSGIHYLLYRLLVKIKYWNNDAMGDGASIGGGKRSILSSKLINASIDHYEIYKLKSFLQTTGDLIIIGHPKNQSEDSIKYLDNFIASTKEIHNYRTIEELAI